MDKLIASVNGSLAFAVPVTNEQPLIVRSIFTTNSGNRGATTLGRTTFSITTLSITSFSIMTLSIMTISIMPFSIKTVSIMTFSITTLSRMTFSIMTISITIHKMQHSAE